MENKSKIPVWGWVVIVGFIIVLIVVYVGSLGNINIGNFSVPKEFKDSYEQAKRRHEKLKSLIEKKEALHKKLTRRFKLVYFAIRLGFVSLWAVYIFICYKVQWVNNLEDVLNFSEAAILIVLAVNFLTFGTLTSLDDFVDSIKMKLENWVFGKYVNIEDSIVEDKEELQKVELRIK